MELALHPLRNQFTIDRIFVDFKDKAGAPGFLEANPGGSTPTAVFFPESVQDMPEAGSSNPEGTECIGESDDVVKRIYQIAAADRADGFMDWESAARKFGLDGDTLLRPPDVKCWICATSEQNEEKEANLKRRLGAMEEALAKGRC